MEKFFIIEDEHNLHLLRKKELEEEYAECWRMKEEACSQSSETWHDNPAFDEAEMKQKMVTSRYKELMNFLNNSRILALSIIENNDKDKVVIWSTVQLLVNWEEKTFTIWWYNTPIEWRISYKTPLAKSIIWLEMWEYCEFRVWNNNVEVEILEIV